MGLAAAALFYAAVTLLLFHNLLPNITTDLYPDLGDPLLNTAVLAWNAEQWPLTADWWNFPSFAPLPGMTSLTEHLLLTYPLTSPLIWLTGNPVLAYNVVLLMVLPLNGVAAYLLARELTGSNAAAFVAGLAFAFAPYQSHRLSNLQTLLQFGMPLALLGLHRYVRNASGTSLLLFGAGWLFTILANAYTLVFFPILVALWCIWFIRPAGWKRLTAIIGLIVVATLPVVPVLSGYETWHSAYGLERSYGEVRGFAADISSLAGISHRELLWRRWLPWTYGEGSLFPGIAIVALAALAVAFGTDRSNAGRGQWSRRLLILGVVTIGVMVARVWTGPDAWRLGPIALPPFRPYRVFTFGVLVLIASLVASSRFRGAWRSRNVWVFYAAAAVIFWLLALGPEPTWFGSRALTYGPYRLLYLFPGAGTLRVPARTWLPAMVCLAMLAGGGAAVLIRRYTHARHWILAVASMFILAEGWFFDTPKPAPVPLDAGLIPNGAMVLDLPIDDVVWNARAQYRAVMGHYRSVNGYSGYSLPGFDAFAQDVIKRRDRALEDLRRRGTVYVVVASAQDPSLPPWVAAQQGVERVGRSGEFVLYRLPELH